MKNCFKKTLSIILILLLVFSQISFAIEYSDTEVHWANNEISKWSEKGLLKGSNGFFKPNDNITRAEMAVIINRLMKYEVRGENVFNDLSETWYTDAILKNSNAGIIKGSRGNVRPEEAITRQEAVVMLSRAFGIEEYDNSTTFKDNDKIADWARGYVKSFSDKGYIKGMPNGRFAPNNNIRRGEVVKIIDNMLSEWITTPGTYTGVYTESVIINNYDVILKDSIIEGDLIIAEGVKDGEVKLDNVDIKGNLKIKGGGENSIYLKDTEVQGKLFVSKQDGKIRIVANGKTSIKLTKLSSGAMLIEQNLNGHGFEEIIVPDEGEEGLEILLDGEFESVETNEDNCTITILKDTNINSFNVCGERTKIICDGKVKQVNIAEGGEKTTIKGKGTVEKVDVSADDTVIDTKGTRVKVNAGIEGTEAGGKKVAGGKTATIGGNKKTGSSNSSGGNIPNPNIDVTSIDINEGNEINIYPSETKMLTVIVKPSNATNKNITWSSSNNAISISNEGTITVNNGYYNTTASAIVTSVSNNSIIDTITVNILEDNLKSVENINEINVIVGTEKSSINFPTTANIILDTQEIISVSLEPWTESQGVTYEKDADGNYQFESRVILPNGITNTNNVSLIVTTDIVVYGLIDAVTPDILSDITNQTVALNSDISLEMLVNNPSDGGTLSYQWYSCEDLNKTNAQEISGENAAIYVPDTSSIVDSFYYCTITNTNNSATGNITAKVDSNVAKVTITSLFDADTPAITNNISNVNVTVGDSVLLDATSTVSDGGTISYQWYCCSDLTGANQGLEDGETNETFGFTAHSSQVGTYYYFCRVTNTNNNATGNTTSSVNTAIAKINIVPAIIEIDKVDELALIGKDTNYPINGSYKLMDNLDFDDDNDYNDKTKKTLYTSGQGFMPIGGNENVFSGVFDGNNNSIKGVFIERSNRNSQGLFYGLQSGAVVKDLELTDVNIYGKAFVGGLAGFISNGSRVENCKVYGEVRGVGNYVGGIVGKVDGIHITDGINTLVTDCYSSVDVFGGSNWVGGITGQNRGVIRNCYAVGDINGYSSYGSDFIGGIAGENTTDTSTLFSVIIENCYSTGDVSSNNSSSGDDVGGIVGRNETATFSLDIRAIVRNCYSLGTIKGDENIGGIVGNNIGSEISNCYATGDVISTNTYENYGCAGGIVGTANEKSIIKNNIAFSERVIAKTNANRIAYFSDMTDVDLDNNYAYCSMAVTEDSIIKTGTSSDTTIWGADRANMTDVSKPYDTWDFDSDTDNDGVYWKIENDKDRPVLYINGSKLGNDNGLLAFNPLSGVHQIYTIEDLQKVGTGNDGWDLDEDYIMMNDIDMSSISEWIPIGNEGRSYGSIINHPFSGSFDGDGYTIDGLKIRDGIDGVHNWAIGFIATTTDTAVVKNINFTNIDVDSTELSGAVVGTNYGGIIDNVNVEGILKSTTNIGGITNINQEGIIKNCSVKADIQSGEKAGGIAVYNKVIQEGTAHSPSVLKNCYYEGNITSEDANIGGIAYSNYGYYDNTYSLIANCYSGGTFLVTGNGDDCGGIAAENYYGKIQNSYSLASVNTELGGACGGIVAYNYGKGEISNCYSTGENIIGLDYVGGIVGATTDGGKIENCIAFNSLIKASRYNISSEKLYAGRVIGGNGPNETPTSDSTNNHAKEGMLVRRVGLEDSPATTPTSTNSEGCMGTNISSLKDVNNQPLDCWEINMDTNNDGAYWKIENGMNRPVLYVDKGNGIYVKLGDDVGL